MTHDRLGCIAILVMIVVMAICVVLCHWRERWHWNGGVCRKNGLPWRKFDCDHGGDRGYRAGHDVLWVSFPVDRHEIQLGVIIVEDEKELC